MLSSTQWSPPSQRWKQFKPRSPSASQSQSLIPFPTNDETYASPKLIMVFLHDDIEWHHSNYGILFFYDNEYFM